MTATLNSHGVFTRGFQTVVVPVRRSVGGRFELTLAQHQGQWHLGYHAEIRGSSTGCGSSSALSAVDRDVFPTREAALRAGLQLLIDIARSGCSRASVPAVRSRYSTAVLDLCAYRDRLPPVPSVPVPEEKPMPATKSPAKNSRHNELVNRGDPSAWRDLVASNERPPDLTSTTLPSGIAAAERKRAGSDGAAALPGRPAPGNLQRLPLDRISRHPDNRLPAETAVAALAESIAQEGLLEPIVVRPQEDGWELISGETRVLALQRLGRQEVEARVIECDDARALELLAVYNAARQDLTPIDKAKLIERLCQPKDQGGGGLTREAAAKIYGLQNGSSASNLVRLLQLPEAWQQRVAAGELAESFARELLRVVHVPPVMAELEKRWKSFRKHGDRAAYEEDFSTRMETERTVRGAVRHACRELGEQHYVDGHYASLKVDAKNPEVREQLGLVEIDGKTYSTNRKAYEAALKSQVQRKAKAAAAKAGADDPPVKREPSADAQRMLDAQKKQQLAARIRGWRHKLLRRACYRQIAEGKDSGLRIVLAHAVDCPGYGERSLQSVLEQMTKTLEHVTKTRTLNCESWTWELVRPIDDDHETEAVVALAKMILQLETSDPRQPALGFNLLDGYAAALGIDVAQEWAAMQADRELLEDFLQLHQTEQLQALAAEWKVTVPPAVKSKPQLVQLLASLPQGTRRLPLPKSIAPLAAAKARPPKKPAKRGAK